MRMFNRLSAASTLFVINEHQQQLHHTRCQTKIINNCRQKCPTIGKQRVNILQRFVALRIESSVGLLFKTS